MDENFILRVTGLNKKFGDLEVLKDVSLTMKPGEVISIIGPSGTGKSTFLRCLNYLEKPTTGTITIDGVTVDSGHARHQDIYALRQKTAMVFQNYNLFKNKTAIQNIMEPLVKVQKVPKEKAEQAAEKLVELGIHAIWNFAHLDLELPDDVVVENVHLSDSLMQLSYNIVRRQDDK